MRKIKELEERIETLDKFVNLHVERISGIEKKYLLLKEDIKRVCNHKQNFTLTLRNNEFCTFVCKDCGFFSTFSFMEGKKLLIKQKKKELKKLRKENS